ncbi:hypothetical protein NC651_027753 [Populus alba x Populus x berolinensis]|nr:hypothetical protein NC651_027753 [Populus alba x Populus x berolinensis]
MAYVLITYSIWFMSITWLFAPFLFNPAGFDWEKIVDDWKNLNKWIRQPGGIGIQQDKSWQSWWNDEQAHLCGSGLGARLFEILLSARFFMYQYGLVYHLDISQKSKNVPSLTFCHGKFSVPRRTEAAAGLNIQGLSSNCSLTDSVLTLCCDAMQAVNMGRQQFHVCDLSMKDLIVCCLAFLPTGWGLILIAQAARPKIEETGLWHFTRVLARAYDYGMSVVLFAPVAVLAWLPVISAFQTRFSFQRALQQALADPANSCREEDEADMILLISQSVHTIFVQSFAVQLRNTFKFILYIS